MSYKEFAYPPGNYKAANSKPGGYENTLPAVNNAPAFAIFINFPPDPTPPARRDILVLYCPIYTMFQEPGVFKEVIKKDYRLLGEAESSGTETPPFTDYSESILGWFSQTPDPDPNSGLIAPWKLDQLGLRRIMNTDFLLTQTFLNLVMKFGAPAQAGYPSQFLYADKNLEKSKCFLKAIDNHDYLVFKSPTRERWLGDYESRGIDTVKGSDAMWRFNASRGRDSDVTPTMYSGGIIKAPQLMINYKTGESDLLVSKLLSATGENASADYVTEILKRLIESAGRINTILNIIQDFKPVSPGSGLKIPPDLKIEIGGHTDKVGPEDINTALSKARADKVIAFLKKKTKEIVAFSGYPNTKDLISSRLRAHGYGSDECNTPAGKDNPRARKVTFRIVQSAG
ncbi:hypothetical protein BH09BAC6_BH09BAC6_14920 [soil metagenome]|jgi:hypothetical protein